MQKSLQGLDNITAEGGTQSIDSLVKIVEYLVENAVDETWGKRIQHKIKEVKRYFKTDFKVHIGKEENCAEYCPTHSLSDPKTRTTKVPVITIITLLVKDASPRTCLTGDKI